MAIFKGHPGQDDSFDGTTAADLFLFHSADLNSSDHVYGGGGDAVDTLKLRDAGTLSAEDLADVGGIELVELADGANSFQVSFEMSDTAESRALTVIGGTGDDIIDGSVASSEAYLTLRGGAGNDTLIGGRGGAELDGGAGRDILRGLDYSFDTYVIGRGDFAKGEVYQDGGFHDEDVLRIGATVDLRSASIFGIETWILGAIDGEGMPARRKITVDVTIDQLYSVSSIHTYAYEDPALNVRETLNIHLIAGHEVYIPPISSDGEDIVNVIGTSSTDTLASSGGVNFVYYGRGGDDFLSFSTAGGREGAYGGAGNDTVSYRIAPGHHPSHAVFDGGRGNDTLELSSFFERNIVVRLAEDDQVLKDGVVSRHFENVYWYNGGKLDAVGDNHDNIIRNAAAYQGPGTKDILDGGGGNDTLDGGWGGAIDTLTGGRGADTFQWTNHTSGLEIVTDFNPKQDKLAFSHDTYYRVDGPLDTLVKAHSTHNDITGADVIIYDGHALDSIKDVQTYLSAATGGGVNEGAFVVGENSAGDAVVYFAFDASYTNSTNVLALADLQGVDAHHLRLSDFSIFGG